MDWIAHIPQAPQDPPLVAFPGAGPPNLMECHLIDNEVLILAFIFPDSSSRCGCNGEPGGDRLPGDGARLPGPAGP